MFAVLGASCAGSLPRLAAVSMIGALLAGCSADTGRFNHNPFFNPFAVSSNTPPAEVTGAVPSQAAPAGHVERQPLAGQGGLPAPPPRTVSATGVAPQSTSVVAMAPKSTPAGGVHVVSPGETLSSIGRLYGKPRAAIAKANNIEPDAKIRIGQRLTVPGVTTAQSTTAVAAATPPKPAAATAAAAPAAPLQKVASLEPVATARVATPATQASADPAAESAAGSGGGFRWPVRGRVIAGFGPKPNGQQNDGINLAVPEGTSVKASEDGVVAYAGNELKGYGNLVLIRHNNGYVTAYAHASEISVKRGDSVKRGQVIGKAGQTGSVSSPQLHFEIRKGSTPVDPMPLLSGT